MTNLWYKDGPFWRKASPGWEVRKYGMEVNGKGDLIFNTLDKIIRDGDTSEWAHMSLKACKDLLINRKRWLDRMNQSCDANTYFEWYVSRIRYKLGIKSIWYEWREKIDGYIPVEELRVLYRPQSDMTRDPYIAFYTACVLLDHKDWINDVTVLRKLWRPNLWAWRKYLITGKKKYKRRYYFWEWFNFFEPGYTKRLTELMEMVI